jgi:WD40 repeat protein
MVKACSMRVWLKETLLQYIPLRNKHKVTYHNEPIYEDDNGEFVIEFTFAREGYSVHTITSHVTNDSVYFVCGSRVGGLKVINGLTGTPIVENVFLTSADLTMVYEADTAYLFSCGREASIPLWSISSMGRSKYLSSLFKHSNAVNTIDSICITTVQRGMVVSKTNYLASGSHDQTVLIWRLENQNWVVHSSFQKHSFGICKLKLFTMGSDLMVASTDHAGHLLVWKVDDQSIYFTYKLHGPVLSIIASNQTKNYPAILAVVDAVGMVNVFDMRRLKLIYAMHNNCYQEFIRSVEIYDRDEQRLLIGGCDDGIIYFWSLSDGELLHRVHAHHSWVNTLHITDGSTPLLVSGGCDSKVSCWNLKRIICNIKYSRRKDYLMFLVGSGYQTVTCSRRGRVEKEECKDEDEGEYSSTVENDSKDKDMKYTTIVFSSQDLCVMIAKFI